MKRLWESRLNNNGFTIIELLVTMAVIAILATIMVVSYNGIQQRSRDSERNSDIALLKIAIERYHAENSVYPATCGVDVGCPISSLETVLDSYLKDLPHDPKYTIDTISDYNFVAGSVASDSYGLLITYEAQAPCKTGRNINVNWWGTGIPTC